MKTPNMPYLSHSRVQSRINDVIVLMAAIVIGIIISATVNAVPSSKIKTTTSVKSVVDIKKNP